jgi:hypothetical protein
VLEGQERILGPEHPEFLKNLNNVAVFYQDQGRLDEAEPLHLRRWRLTSAPSDRSTQTPFSVSGTWHCSTGTKAAPMKPSHFSSVPAHRNRLTPLLCAVGMSPDSVSCLDPAPRTGSAETVRRKSPRAR